MEVLHCLRGHDSDVQSLCWCPVALENLQLGHLQEKAVKAKGNLIISGSKDHTIRLWDALNGKVLSIFTLPKKSSQKWKDRQDWQSKDRVWVALFWSNTLPNKVISSSHSGDLLLWDLSASDASDQCQFFGHGHSRIVFNISCNKEETKAVSFSLERQIIIWDLKTLHSIYSISTLGGFVNTLDISPLDPGTVAVGVGDDMIRIWRTDSPSNAYDTVTLWQGIKSKVQVVSWHPSKEGILAFGMVSGQVGIYNTVSKKPKVFASYHKNTVYSLSWGPACPKNEDKEDNELNLYSCSSDGIVMEHCPSHPLLDSVDVNKLIQTTNGAKYKLKTCTEVSWNCNRSVLAIGNLDGSIQLFVVPNLRGVCSISVHQKSITRLVWHPGYGEDSSEDEERLPYRLASGSNGTTIHIHDLSGILENVDDQASVPNMTLSYRNLHGHSGRVASLCWSPHHRDLLVSGSYDGTAQVWNVETQQTVANFRGHRRRVFSVQWSYLDNNVLYSGGEDGCVRVWKMSEQKYTQPPAYKTSKGKQKFKSKSKLSIEAKTSQTNNDGPLDGETLQQPVNALPINEDTLKTGENTTRGNRESCKRPQTSEPAGSVQSDRQITSDEKGDKSVVMAAIDDEDASSESSLSAQGLGPTVIVSKSKGESTKKKKKVKSLFPLSAVADNSLRSTMQQDCIKLAQFLANSQSVPTVDEDADLPGESSCVNLGLFADLTGAYKMFEAEGRNHSSSSNLENHLQLEIWKGNLQGAIEKAIKTKQLCDWLVAMSAQGGQSVWLYTAECYAKQLQAEGSYHRAVLYYLGCNRVYDAIDVFKNQSMFREAIALAKVRLPPSDPVLHGLYCAWAKRLEMTQYENAAKCYLAAGYPAEAVRVLTLRGDQVSLTTALKVSVASNLHQLASSIAVRLMHLCMWNGNWCAAEEALALCNDVEGHCCALYAHEILVNELLEQRVIIDTKFQEKEHSKNFYASKLGEHESIIDNLQILPHQDSYWLFDPQLSSGLISRVLKAWDRVGVLGRLRTTHVYVVDQLSSYAQSNLNENLSVKQILTRISYDISLGLLNGILQDNYACSLPWLQALESCIKNNYFLMVQFLCVQLLPRGAHSLEDLSQFREAMGESIGSNRELVVERQISNDKIFSYFTRFYWLVALYKIWWQKPEVLHRFSVDTDKNIAEPVTDTVTSGFALECAGHDALDRAAEKIMNEMDDISNASFQENDDSDNLINESETVTKRPMSSCLNPQEISPNCENLDICTFLSMISKTLLDETVVTCSKLKQQLLEVKKEVILLRSRKILDSVAASGSSKQKKTAKKKHMTKKVSEKARGSLVKSDSVEQCDSIDTKVEDGDGQDIMEYLEKKYKSRYWTLEFMQEEEQRIMKELSKYPLKDLPYPDPTEAAIVLGLVCSNATSYPCLETSVLYDLGLEVVNSGLANAQWATQQTTLQRIQKCLSTKIPK